MDTLNFDTELILKFLTGEATEPEKAELLNWVKESSANRKLYMELKDVWEASEASNSGRFNSESAWKQFNGDDETDNEEIADNTKLRTLTYTLLKIAATVIITFGLSWLFFSQSNSELQPLPAQIAINEINVPLGSKTQIVLPDGTKVWINSGSKLVYNTDFNGATRVVNLTGEAFFEVVKNPSKPFVVKTGKMDVKAYGTKFNVKSYPEDGYIETTLVEGVVTLDNEMNNQRIATLKPKQKTVYKKDDGIVTFEKIVKQQERKGIVEKIVDINKKKGLILSETKPEIVTAWREQKLYFVSETLEEIATKLERWYGVKIHLKDNKLKNERFTGRFTHNEPVVQVLEAIKLTTSIEYKINQNEIYISDKTK